MLSQNRTREGKDSRRAGDLRALKAACGLRKLLCATFKPLAQLPFYRNPQG